MNGFRLSFPANAIAGKRSMDQCDLDLLKNCVLPEVLQTQDELMTLLVLNNCCPEKCPGWQDFYSEKVATYIFSQLPPRFGMDGLKLAWLMQTFTTEGHINNAADLKMLSLLMNKLQPKPALRRQPPRALRQNRARAVRTIRLMRKLHKMADEAKVDFKLRFAAFPGKVGTGFPSGKA